MDELFEEYKKYTLLQKKDSMMTGIEAGTVSFIVSVRWMKTYLNFILHDQFKRDVTENDLQVNEDHFTKNYPGPISNEVDLLEVDND